jgi:hypothetical protein
MSRISQTIYAIPWASALVGSGVLIRARFYTLLHRLQPGHWLVLIVSLDFLLWLVARLLHPFLGLAGNQPISTVTSETGAAMTWMLIAAAYVLAFVKLRDAKRWKILVGAKMVGAGMNAVMSLIFLITCLFTGWPYTAAASLAWISVFPGIWFVAVFIMLVTVAVLDLRCRASRDWLHWLGVSVVVVANVLTFATFLRLLLPGRLL